MERDSERRGKASPLIRTITDLEFMDHAMTTIGPLPAPVAHRIGAIVEHPAAAEQRDLLADAIRLADSPAFFAVWQDGSDSMRLFVDVLLQADITTPHIVRP